MILNSFIIILVVKMNQRNFENFLDFSALRKKEDDPDLFNKFIENSS